MKSFARVSTITGLTLGLSACGTLYKIDVTAYSDPGAELDKSYVILSGNPDIGVGSPEFEHYASQVERALAKKGYARKQSEELGSAALGIYLSADISEPGKKFHTVTRGIYESPYAENSTAVTRASNSNSGQQNQRPQPVVTPPPEILAGYEETGFATTVYTKHMSLVAIDLQQYIRDIEVKGRIEAAPREIWSLQIETTGQPSDLSEVFPVMVAAGQPYIGDSTEDVVQVKMSDTDKRISAIKGSP